jgi:hypothetical protein
MVKTIRWGIGFSWGRLARDSKKYAAKQILHGPEIVL